ncbi:unnamed protein product [Ambrosiozyma monospora]|uniref:Unnamed protein product n=1 Tax=Ambrosiozyma monospora TaxID=43982 RepID=A0A9W6YVJ6_AMBMO|nr:unnamed protein product [Ambrosiozyma monospora]
MNHDEFIPDPSLPPKRRHSFSIDVEIPQILPHERMYSIQIGYKMFKLSGASLSSDAPSYFTNYFSNPENENKVLIIDRSPKVFEKIYMHLQGYAIKIDDENEFLHLFTDSVYFHLVKLKELVLKYDIFANIGGKCFRISKELLTSDGNYPNYFSFTFNCIMKEHHQVKELQGLIRPPNVTPYTSARSSALFQDLLDKLQGKSVVIRNDEHRKNLIEECRYYKFKALEQEFVKCRISVNPFSKDEEIVMNYRDIVNSKVSSINGSSFTRYSRPYVDNTKSRVLVLQVESSEVSLLINLKTDFVSLLVLGKCAKKLNGILSQVSDDVMYEVSENSNGTKLPRLTVLIHIKDCFTIINGMEMEIDWIKKLCPQRKPPTDTNMSSDDEPGLSPSGGDVIEVKVLKSQWYINTSGRDKLYLTGRMIQGVLDQMNYYKSEGFL